MKNKLLKLLMIFGPSSYIVIASEPSTNRAVHASSITETDSIPGTEAVHGAGLESTKVEKRKLEKVKNTTVNALTYDPDTYTLSTVQPHMDSLPPSPEFIQLFVRPLYSRSSVISRAIPKKDLTFLTLTGKFAALPLECMQIQGLTPQDISIEEARNLPACQSFTEMEMVYDMSFSQGPLCNAAVKPTFIDTIKNAFSISDGTGQIAKETIRTKANGNPVTVFVLSTVDGVHCLRPLTLFPRTS